MVKKQVILSVCDNCHKEATTDMAPKRAEKGLKNEDFLLPDGWAHMRIDTNEKTLYGVDLCDECVKPVTDLMKVKVK
jgi:hypothetical protein